MAKLKVWFLNVGQGDSTYIEFTDSKNKVWRLLIDCNLDKREKCPGIDVIAFLRDQMPTVGHCEKLHLDYLIVTHPHADHIRGLAAIGHDYTIGELWDSGHKPEKAMADSDLYRKYEKVKEKHKDVLKADDDHKCSRTPLDICGGELKAHILRPSKYVEGETADAVHAECMVIKLSFNDFHILFSGDSNCAAWKEITAYKPFKDNPSTFKAQVLHASHHGSRTFFVENKDDDPFMEAINLIDPDHVVISVPSESVHGHPHDEAMKIYKDKVGQDEIYQTHENTAILEVDAEGTYTLDFDDGTIQKEYGMCSDDDDDPEGGDGNGCKTNGSTPATPRKPCKSRSTLDDQGSA